LPSARLRACGVRRAWPCPAALSGLAVCVSGLPGPRVFARLLAGCLLFSAVSGHAVCGFRRGLSCPPSFVRMCFLSFTVCRRMPWLLAAFSGDFLFPDSCPAPFVCVGRPLFPAVFGHAWCGFRREIPVPALSVLGLSPQAGLVRQALSLPPCLHRRSQRVQASEVFPAEYFRMPTLLQTGGCVWLLRPFLSVPLLVSLAFFTLLPLLPGHCVALIISRCGRPAGSPYFLVRLNLLPGIVPP